MPKKTVVKKTRRSTIPTKRQARIWFELYKAALAGSAYPYAKTTDIGITLEGIVDAAINLATEAARLLPRGIEEAL